VFVELLVPFSQDNGYPGSLLINGSEYQFAYTPSGSLPTGVYQQIRLWHAMGAY
jgi:hypothetical protein